VPFAIVFGFLACFADHAFAQSVPTILRGPYLQSATITNLIVRWRTDLPTESRVLFGPVASNLASVAFDPTPTTEHAVTLPGLAPDTRYYYAITAGIYLLVGGPSYSFVTPPASPKPTRIWAIGDCGTASFGSTAPLAVRDGYASFTAARPTDVWLMLGDNAYYSGTDQEYQGAVFNVFQQLLRTTPLWSTLGNHETYGPDAFGNLAYFDIFDLPQDGRAGGVASGTERYYSFDYGNVHFVCLDSEISDKSAGGSMVTWLEEDLAANSKDWLIAFWHSPPYSRGSHNSDVEASLFLMRQSIVPVLENYGVDLVLCGHSHSYERSYLLHGHYGLSSSLTSSMVLDGGSGRSDETGPYLKSPASGAGAVYIVAGSAGQTSGGPLNHPAMFVSLNRLGSLVIDVESNRLDASFVRETGVVEDRFSIFKGPVAPVILAHPTSQTVIEGDSVSFSVTASGSPPLSYHWSFNGAAVAEAGASVLNLANVATSQAGDYSVIVSNAYGVAVSSNAFLVVNPPPPRPTNCISAPVGLVAWWPFDGSGADLAGTNRAAVAGAIFGAGQVDRALSLNGANGASAAPSPELNVGLGNGFTVEGWIKPTIIDERNQVIFEWSDRGANVGLHLSLSQRQPYGGGPGSLWANLLEVNGAAHWFPTAGGLVASNVWSHVALTYDRASGAGAIYCNGVSVAQANFGNLAVDTRFELLFGRRMVGSETYYAFAGAMDEMSLYRRALSAAEIQAVHAIGAAGKCKSIEVQAPAIHTQPMSLATFVSQSATFVVGATGVSPLHYQWFHEGVALPGATGASLTLNSLQPSDAGDYSVTVSNAAGFVISSNATLSVSPLPPCLPVPEGLVAWWTFDGDGADQVGGNTAVTPPGAVFGEGKVAGALIVGGTSLGARAAASPALNVGAGPGLTIEGWIKPSVIGEQNQVIFEWSDGLGNVGVHLSLSQRQPYGGGPGSIWANLIEASGTAHWFPTAGGLVAPNVWSHLALTYDKASGAGVLYCNGIAVAAQNFGQLTLGTAYDLIFGRRIVGTGTYYPFAGGLDEVSLYRRALSASEIQFIHLLGAAGKCPPTSAPVITTAPGNVTVTQGDTASFSVGAAGSRPLHYQWLYDGEPITDATNATIQLADVQASQAGPYSVVVSNGFGSVTSTAATLTVLPPPSALRVVSIQAASGVLAEVPVRLAANGQENAIGFSLTFDPGLLELDEVVLDPGAPDEASLLINDNDAAAGRVGMAVALPAGQTFPAGIRDLVSVRFKVAVVLSPVSTTIGFGDAPTARQVANALAQSLAASYAGGTVAVARVEFEADVAPQPAGDFGLTVLDWVQSGRFVARLDAVTSSNEFQRADCAPRATKGNGLITVSDWVQAGRYAVGLDSLVTLGGPIEEAGGDGGGFIAAALTGRQLCLVNTSIAQGQTNQVPVTLECQGNENAASFSVVFDPAKLAFVSATLGSGSAGALLNLNASEVAQGRLGVALARPPGTTFPAGMREILQLQFAPLVSAPATVALSFGNDPVPREVSDATANPLPTDYTAGSLNITPPPGPPLRVTRSGGSLLITWPSSATGFELEGTAGGFGAAWSLVPGVIDLGEQMLAIIPIGSGERYFRLKKP
jgi:3',5'-cyclic AMP phosphodiesterase CpdA